MTQNDIDRALQLKASTSLTKQEMIWLADLYNQETGDTLKVPKCTCKGSNFKTTFYTWFNAFIKQ